MQGINIEKRRTSADCRLCSDSIIHDNTIKTAAEVKTNKQLYVGLLHILKQTNI